MLWLPQGPEALHPIVKIPLLLSSAYLVHQALTPPNPPSDKSSTAAYSGKQDILSNSTVWGSLASTFKLVHWLNAATESVIIIGGHYPSYLPSQLLFEPQRDIAGIRATPIWLSGCLLLIGGSLIRLSCYRTLGRLFTWDLTIKNDHKLATSGPYAVVRHPSYVGSTMIGVGTVLCHLGKGSWFFSYNGLETVWGKGFAVAWAAVALWIPAVLLRRVNVEDEALHNRFGGEWVAYARRTPYKLIPFVY